MYVRTLTAIQGLMATHFEMPDDPSDQTDARDVVRADSETPAAIAPIPASIPDAKRFLLAGKAIFTLVGRDSRYTYKIAKVEPVIGSRYTMPAYFVSLLTGPDNTSEYTYLGVLDAGTGQVRLTAKSHYRDDSVPVKAIRWAFGYIWSSKDLPAPARVLHAGRCGRCGRLLTVPSSIETGFGPECAGKI